MALQLAPCPKCSRHLRINESRCPFCEAPLEARVFAQLRGQAAAMLAGVTLVLAGCNAPTEQSPAPSNKPSEVKPVPLEEKAPESQPGAVLAPTSTTTPTITPPPEPAPRLDAPAYGLAPKPRPRPAMKYGAPPPPIDSLDLLP